MRPCADPIVERVAFLWQRLFFATRTEAAAECETLKARRDNFGISLTAMTPATISEAAEAYKLLGSTASLLDAVRGYLETYSQRKASTGLRHTETAVETSRGRSVPIRARNFASIAPPIGKRPASRNGFSRE
jgi:hypothetical protein